MEKILKRIVFVGILFIVIASVLIAVENYFNWQKINALVEGADARGLDYELTITDALTSDYQFETKAS